MFVQSLNMVSLFGMEVLLTASLTNLSAFKNALVASFLVPSMNPTQMPWKSWNSKPFQIGVYSFVISLLKNAVILTGIPNGSRETVRPTKWVWDIPWSMTIPDAELTGTKIAPSLFLQICSTNNLLGGCSCLRFWGEGGMLIYCHHVFYLLWSGSTMCVIYNIFLVRPSAIMFMCFNVYVCINLI